jgi:predicted ribonuclease YlaK
LTRPSVLIDNDAFGALPGGVEEKMDPLLSHIADIVGEATSSVISSTWTLTKQHAIKVVPLEYTRGLTFHDSFVVADEMQVKPY